MDNRAESLKRDAHRTDSGASPSIGYLNLSGSGPLGCRRMRSERNVGQLTFDGLGPYDLPDATHADARRDGDGFRLSFRMWKSEREWTLVRIHVSGAEVDKLVRQIGDARAGSDGSTII
jgi:hypothetical protein